MKINHIVSFSFYAGDSQIRFMSNSKRNMYDKPPPYPQWNLLQSEVLVRVDSHIFSLTELTIFLL